MEYSLGVLKPDCIERNLISEVLKMIEIPGLKVVAGKRLRLTQDNIDVLYARNIDKDFYLEMSLFLCSDDVYVYVVKGDDAINRLNEIVGDTDPQNAKNGTIRNKYGQSVRRNITHSSMNEESFWKELNVFFSKEEICSILT